VRLQQFDGPRPVTRRPVPLRIKVEQWPVCEDDDAGFGVAPRDPRGAAPALVSMAAIRSETLSMTMKWTPLCSTCSAWRQRIPEALPLSSARRARRHNRTS
jgi:hypothetical protein